MIHFVPKSDPEPEPLPQPRRINWELIFSVIGSILFWACIIGSIPNALRGPEFHQP